MKKIFIDTDMAIDDIIAILLLIQSPTTRITGVSTVKGILEATTGAQSILNVLSSVEYDIDVCSGSQIASSNQNATFPIRDCNRSKQYLIRNFELVNGTRIKKNVEDFIFNKFKEKQILIALGPLTNVAKTINKYGRSFLDNVDKIYLMGGGIYEGNVPGRLAEYNIWLDPISAKTVFESDIPIVMVGIDATKCVPATNQFKKMVKKIKPRNKISSIIKDIIVFNKRDFNFFYDPLLSFIFLNNSAVSEKINCAVSVGLQKKDLGQTIITKEGFRNTEVILGIKQNKFYDFILQAVSK